MQKSNSTTEVRDSHDVGNHTLNPISKEIRIIKGVPHLHDNQYLTRFPLPRFLAYVQASGGFSC